MLRSTPASIAIRHLGVRWAIIVIAGVIGFAKTWDAVLTSVASGTTIAYVWGMPFLCLVAATGLALRKRPGLPIHDRQTDVIVGVLGMVLVLAVLWLLMPRFGIYYWLVQMDVVAAWIFTAASAVLLFGLRPVASYWPVWLLPLIMTPLMYRMLATLLGGSRFAYGFVMVVLASVAIAIAVGRTRRRALVAFFCSIAAGTVALSAAILLLPEVRGWILQVFPGLLGAVVTGAGFYLYQRRGASLAPLDRPLRQPAVSRSVWSGSLVVAVVAVLVLLIPLPPRADLRGFTPGPPATGEPTLIVPSGWSETALTEYDWQRSYFGRESTLNRQTIRTDRPHPDWDDQNRPRIVQIDTLTTEHPSRVRALPAHDMYRLDNARASDRIPVDIGRGITALFVTVIDDSLLLTWSRLQFEWSRGDGTYQRVILISVDNHNADAYFPQPTPSMLVNLGTAAQILLRGASAVTDENPEYKDRGMLETLGRQLVEAQSWQ
ncbi:hypothetical protein G4H71_13435 [Rhodococcus triatomae]|uniref:Exosortase/archaeosortase family protein n=1 Tax=Rhodococcus triatomae TaxID=300028 RepID=A0A1G8H6P2_9NOCA|nr:hypothetical protein [Rhodococcus triatomae]QNG20193.1 hypothetical protein G4H72_16945 [Rhodococcus triatomae]QNG23892.1 hypothetical protein G4H71_13435 [Rhodococcus triatomae]SDI02201.1 hypothetical protein SAMN05444695_104332 [Rhodococcus triatomae]